MRLFSSVVSHRNVSPMSGTGEPGQSGYRYSTRRRTQRRTQKRSRWRRQEASSREPRNCVLCPSQSWGPRKLPIGTGPLEQAGARMELAASRADRGGRGDWMTNAERMATCAFALGAIYHCYQPVPRNFFCLSGLFLASLTLSFPPSTLMHNFCHITSRSRPWSIGHQGPSPQSPARVCRREESSVVHLNVVFCRH